MVQFCYKGLYLGIENVCLSCVATDGKDGHGLKRENVGPTFSSFKADTHDGFCSRRMLQAHFARVSTHEGAFSSSLNLPRELAPKYLTC